MYAHFSSGPYNSMDDFVNSVFTRRSYQQDNMLTYAIYTRENSTSEPVSCEEEGTVAGMMSLVKLDPENRSAEVGILQILPSQRSKGIATKAGRLLAWHALQPVTAGGMGLVRLEWHVAMGNGASERVARNLQFKNAGLIKYEKLLKNGVARGKAGNNRPCPPGTLDGDLWRDVTIYALSWDEWSPDGCNGYRSVEVEPELKYEM